MIVDVLICHADGTQTLEQRDIPDPTPDPNFDPDENSVVTWGELAEAYTEGVNSI